MLATVAGSGQTTPKPDAAGSTGISAIWNILGNVHK